MINCEFVYKMRNTINNFVYNKNMVRRIISLIDSFDSFIWFINNESKSKNNRI